MKCNPARTGSLLCTWKQIQMDIVLLEFSFVCFPSVNQAERQGVRVERLARKLLLLAFFCKIEEAVLRIDL